MKRVPNGEYSRRIIDTIKEGDEFITIGASGFFTLPADLTGIKQFVFLAAGSGITPIFSLIKTILYSHPDKKVLLIYSNKSEADTIFLNALKKLVKDFPDRFVIEFFFSNSLNITHARISNIWLEALLKKDRIMDFGSTLFYLCGPFDYMLMVTITLLSNGVDATHIRKEHFSTFKPEIRQQPPDRQPHEVKLLLGEKIHSFHTQYPVSILDKARQMGLDLPFSCEAGRCGTCVARCTEGNVWMSNNEVLLEEEIEKGLILTCVGYPVGGDVTIQI